MPLLEKPDPGRAGTVDDLVERLRLLKIWAGDPSYETIKDRVNAAWTAAGRPAAELTRRSTVANCFVPGRRRLNNDLVLAVVQALNPDEAYVSQWRQALRVVGGEIEAVSQVRVQDELPRELPGFTGRAGELDRLRDTGSVAVIDGMAGVGKTHLAVRAGHQFVREKLVERVLFVNLRGFHPDPAQPPADPAAVLDGFLRLLGVPSHQIPHGEAALAAAYRDRLAGRRTLVILDDAATAEQVRPLLPQTPGSRALITSRRSLDGLGTATRLGVGVFTPAEAVAFLTGAAGGVPVGSDPAAAARIARRCGYLPLALSLIAGHIRNTADWTLTDHADRLDERHRDRRLDTGVELAFELSYRHLPAGHQRLLRLAALHPGQDIDAYAAAALAGLDLGTAQDWLDQLCGDHLLQAAAPGRYAFHDLVRDYATTRAHDEDPPADRRDALTRLFDYYLTAAAGAMDTVNPADEHAAPGGVVIPDLSDPDAAVTWLGTERPTLIAVAGYTAAHGWPTHTTRLARTLYMYLANGHHGAGIRVHGHAYRAATAMADPAAQARALTDQAIMYFHRGEIATGIDQLHRALALYGTGHPEEQGRILNNLADVEERAGRHDIAIEHQRRALALSRAAGDRNGESRALCGLGILEERAGRYETAGSYYREALELARQAGSRSGEANMLNGIGGIEMRLGRYDSAERHLAEGLALSRRFGLRVRQGEILDSMGLLHLTAGRLDEAAAELGQALAIYEEVGDRDGVAWAHNGLGEVAVRAGRFADALGHHDAAHAVAAEVDDRTQQARAYAGLGHAHRGLGDPDKAREHFERAVELYAAAGMPEADELRALLLA